MAKEKRVIIHYTGNGLELKSHGIKLEYDHYYDVDQTLYTDLRREFPSVCNAVSRNGQKIIEIKRPQSMDEYNRDKAISQNAMSKKSFYG